MQELADEARADIFNADHIVRILVGHSGPWLDKTWSPQAPHIRQLAADIELAKHIGNEEHVNNLKAQLHEARRRTPINVVFIRNQLDRMREALIGFRAESAARAKWNRRLGHIKGLVKGSGIAAYRKQSILRILDEEQRQCQKRPRRDSNAPISRSPLSPETGQAFWTALIFHLVRYLKRTTRQKEKVVFAITAEILNRVSGGAYPAGERGTALVKQRYWRAL
jgi:hypothetical protein